MAGQLGSRWQHCVPLHTTLGMLPTVPLLCRTGEYVLSPCHSCLWLQQPLISPSRESGSLTQWCNISAQMQSAAGKRKALWLPGSLRQAHTVSMAKLRAVLWLYCCFACHQCQVKSGCLSEIPPTWLLVSVQTLDPILRWARQHFQAEFDVTSSIFGSQHNPDATSAVSSYLQGQQPGSLSNCISNMRLCLELLSDLTLPCRPGPLGAGSCRKPGRGLSLCADGPSDHAGP